MLAIIAVILIIFWGIGFFAHLAGSFIHLVLLVALVMFVMHFFTGKKV